MASLVISVIIASMGTRMRLTPKIEPTPAKHAAMPGERMPADAQERGGAERDEDQVAGVGGDARQHADEDQDEA